MLILKAKHKTKQYGFLTLDGISGWAIILAAVAMISTVIVTGSTSLKVGKAVTVVQKINLGAVDWATGRTTGVTGVVMSLLSGPKYIPSTLADGVAQNPWGGDYKIAKGTTIYDFIVTVTNVPAAECSQLADKLSDFQGTCTAATKEVTAVFTI